MDIRAPIHIDLDFELWTIDGKVFDARRLLGRPTILVPCGHFPAHLGVLSVSCSRR
jgi:hypothetical protein